MATTINRLIKVWVKIGNNESEKIEIRVKSDMDDLKNEVFIRNKEEKRQYYGVFNNEKLSSSACVPHDTTGENPILFLKFDENDSENNSNDKDDVRVTVTHLNAEYHSTSHSPQVSTPIISLAEHLNETRPSTTSSTVITPIINTTVIHLPPHLVETIHYPNGDKYVGEINTKGEPNGKGIMSWKNGRRYEGQWTNGKKEGQGIEYGANGAVNFSGEWKDDVLMSS